MAEEVAKLKATVELDTNKTEVKVKKLDEQFNKLEKTIRKVDSSLTKQELNQQKLAQALEKSKQATVNSSIAEEKLIQAKEKSKQATTKSIVDEQKLATEREKTRKATTQAEQAELRLAKQKDSLNKKNLSLRDSIVQATTKSWLYIKAISSLTEAFASGSKEAVNFQRDMSQVNTLTNFNKDDLKSYSKEVGNLGVEMGKMPSEMAKGMYTVQSIVDESVDSMWVLREATKASIASNTGLSDTVDTGMGIINAYGFEISDLTRVYDTMFTTFDIGNVTMEELSQHLGNVVSSAVKAKVPFETFMGQLAFLTARGMKTAEATTALARGYDAIYEKKDILKEVLDVDVEENGKLRDTTVILGEIGQKLQEYDDISKISIVQKLGLQERADKYFTFMSQEADKAQQTIDKVSNSLGKTETAYNNATDNISTEVAKTKASIVMDFNDMIASNETLIRFFIKLGKIVGIIATGIVEAFKTPIDLFFKLATFGQTTGFQDWLIKTQELLKKFGIGSKEATENFKDLSKDIKDTNFSDSLKKSSNGFKDWAGDLKGYFQNVMNNSSTMAVEVAKNMLATITAFQTYSKSMPKAKAKGLLKKDARLQGYSEEWIAENIDAPLETLYSNPETVSILQKVIAGGGKLKSLEDVPSGGNSGKNTTGNGTTDTSKPITLQSMKDEYDLEISNAKNYAKERGLTEEELQKNLLSINDSYGQKALEQNKKEFTDWSSTLFNNANAIQDSIDMTELQNKAIEDNSKNYEEMSKDSEDYFNNMIDNFDKIKYNTTEYEDEFTVAFRGKNSVESMNSTYDTLFEKYKGNTEALELLTDIYNDQTGSIETFSDKLSSSASFVSELSSVLDNEFLSSLANAMNGISSMSSVIGNAGGIANLGFGGWASIATSALSIVAPIIESWSGDGGIADKQEAAAQVFEDAVETFKAAIEDYSTAEKINYANLTKPSSLSEITSGIGNGDVGWGASDAFDIFDKPDNATYDISALKTQLTNAGYVDLAGQLDSIMGKYAQYGKTHNWYGGHESYIKGYDTVGFLTEVNALIEEAYQTNLDAYKEQVGLTSDSFVSAIKEGMENATDLDISSMIESAFYESYSAMIGEVFGENIGDTISETIFDVLENSGVTQSDLANMSVSEQIAYIQSLMDNSSTYLSEVFEQLGLSASKVSEEFDSLSNQDLPSLVKIGAFEALASNNYTSSTTINVASVYGSVDRTFVNLTNTAVNSTTNKRTLN